LLEGIEGTGSLSVVSRDEFRKFWLTAGGFCRGLFEDRGESVKTLGKFFMLKPNG
jgi:hypothetical protein